MSLGKRLLTTGGAGVCLTENVNPFTGESADNGIALLSMDYDASDASGNFDGVPTNVTFGIGGKTLYAGRFNGSSSIIRFADNSFKNTTFSVSMWVKSSDWTQSYVTLFNAYDNDGTNGGASFGVHNNKAWIFAGGGAGSPSHYVSTGTSLTDGAWQHLVYRVSGTSLKAYLNSSEVLDVTIGSNLAYRTNHNFNIGAREITGTSSTNIYGYVNGDIDQFRYFTSALTTDQISTLWNSSNGETACVHTATANTADFPTGATAVAHYPLDNSSKDNKGTNDGTETDIEYRFAKYGQAAVFNGTSSEITASSFTSLSQVGISMWVNMPDISQQAGLIARYGTNREFAIYMYSGNLTASIYYNGNNGNATTITTSTYMSNNTWHHIAYTANGSTAPKLYIDGSEVGTPQHTDAAKCAYYTSSEPLDIGHFAGVSSYNYEGKIDQVRIYSLAITSSQVTELYNEKPETDTSNFKATLYSGDNVTTGNYVSNVGFQPDFVWIKPTSTSGRHLMQDVVNGPSVYEGAGRTLHSNETFTSNTYGEFTSFEANGFIVQFSSGSQYFNNSGRDYAAWNWKAGGDSVSNNDGSLASTISANPTAGFSIVRYTGTASYTDTVGHGLSSAPEIVIQRPISSVTDWYVLFNIDGTGAWDWAKLNTHDAFQVDNPQRFATSSTTINNWGWNTYDMINYCWHSVAGYSKIGTYSGTNSSGNTAITGLGFTPSFFMAKRNDVNGNSWTILDDKRVESNGNLSELFADTASGESGSGYDVDFVSGGITINSTSSNLNALGTNNYIYMAFK